MERKCVELSIVYYNLNNLSCFFRKTLGLINGHICATLFKNPPILSEVKVETHMILTNDDP